GRGNRPRAGGGEPVVLRGGGGDPAAVGAGGGIRGRGRGDRADRRVAGGGQCCVPAFVRTIDQPVESSRGSSGFIPTDAANGRSRAGYCTIMTSKFFRF